MSFMEPQITDKQDWFEIDTDNGIWYVPFNIPNCRVTDALACVENEDEDTIQELLLYTEGTELNEVTVVHGYGVRLSADGYMDCTEWDIFTNKREAMRAYRELQEEEGE